MSTQHPVLIDELPDHTVGDQEAGTILRDPHTRVVPDDAIAGDRIEQTLTFRAFGNSADSRDGMPTNSPQL